MSVHNALFEESCGFGEKTSLTFWKLTSSKEITVFFLEVCQSSLSPSLKGLQREFPHPLITHGVLFCHSLLERSSFCPIETFHLLPFPELKNNNLELFTSFIYQWKRRRGQLESGETLKTLLPLIFGNLPRTTLNFGTFSKMCLAFTL